MLQQILKDMYIDPDVLDALNEDQKKTLFLKMRQEQVRRWKEHEEKEGTTSESLRPKPKTAKNVSWMLGRDGDVAVLVIEEVDELKASKLISSGLGERKAPCPQNNTRHQATILKSNLVNRTTTEPVRAGRENLPPKTQAGIQLNLKENAEEVRTLPPLKVSVSEQQPPTAAVERQPELKQDLESDAPEEKPASLSTIAYRPHPRVSLANLRLGTTPTPGPAAPKMAITPSPGPAAPKMAITPSPGPANLKMAITPTPDPANLRLGTTPSLSLSSSPYLSPVHSSSAAKTDAPEKSVTPPSLTTRLHPQEPQEPLPQESAGNRDIRVFAASRRAMPEEAGSDGRGEACSGRGRVAQLMKTFSATPPAQSPPRGSKPPIPTKPSHLRLVSTPSLR